MTSISRNQLCPCGSGDRYKHCCGRAPAAIPADAISGEPVLSIVLPWFRKLDDFRQVLPRNLRYFSRPGIEVVLVLDENSEETDLLALLDRYPQVRWQVIVNDVPHRWRPPCRAINVGLRHSAGRYVLVASPESVFVGDVPAYALQVVSNYPNGIAIGRVGWARFDDLVGGRSPQDQFAACVPAEPLLLTFYGSICGPRTAFEAVRGYDESFTTGGGDDDNVRVRLEMNGCTLLACPELRLLHLSAGPRDGSEHFDPENDFLKCTPSSPLGNPDVDWGREFARVARCYDPRPAAGSEVQDRGSLATYARPRPESVMPTGSRRRCGICARRLHYDSPIMACTGCGASPAPISNDADQHVRPKIGCVMQLRNEERYLEGCLAHLREHVDGIIALDDGSTDATREILEREPSLLAVLHHSARGEHVWRERDNKRQLLQRARELDLDWVLCCDADERYERTFLENLKAIAGSFPPDQLVCIWVTLRELWNSPRQYRVDGIWGRKKRARFFRLPRVITFNDDQDLHGQWYPDQTRKNGRMLRIGHALYHLKSIHRDDRERRSAFYNRIDPERRFQPEGYDYLADEGDDLRLEAIPPGREYDYGTLPPDLRGGSD